MKISELIKKLSDIGVEHGDVAVRLCSGVEGQMLSFTEIETITEVRFDSESKTVILFG